MSIIHPSDFELFDETLTVAKRLPGLREITHRIVLPGDQELSVRSYFYSLGASVEATRLVGVMFDISQLSEAMHSLRAMDQRSKLALSESQDGLFDWDLVTNKVTYNARAADLMGLKNGHSESEFSSLLDLVHPGDRDSGLKAVQDHLDGLAPFFEYELRIRFSDGKYHWVHLRGKALRDTEGKPARLLGLSTDIDNRKHAELALRESEEWLRGAVEGSFDAIKILRSVRNELGVVVDFELLELNARVEELAGRKRSELIGKRFSSLYPAYRTNGDFEKYVQVVETRVPFEEERIESFDVHGSRWFHVQGVPVADGISVTTADITKRKEAERVLVDNQRFIEKLASSLPEVIYVVDMDETVISYQNRDFLSQLGYPSDMFARGLLSLCDLVHADEIEACEDHRRSLMLAADDEVIETTCRLRTAEDEWRWFRIRSVIFRRNSIGEPLEMIRTIHDVSSQMRNETALREKVRQLRLVQMELRERQNQLEHLNQQLASLATTDGLTGLYNYRAFHEKLEEEVRRARRYGYPLSVIIADVDDFKAYNDRFGHPAGDERLRQFASLLADNARESDYVARYGGEEFAMILINTSAADGVKCAQRVIDRLNKVSESKRLTASFGCVQLEPDDESKDSLIRRADDCLYSAKRQGKNRVVVSVNDAKTAKSTA